MVYFKNPSRHPSQFPPRRISPRSMSRRTLSRSGQRSRPTTPPQPPRDTRHQARDDHARLSQPNEKQPQYDRRTHGDEDTSPPRHGGRREDQPGLGGRDIPPSVSTIFPTTGTNHISSTSPRRLQSSCMWSPTTTGSTPSRCMAAGPTLETMPSVSKNSLCVYWLNSMN